MKHEKGLIAGLFVSGDVSPIPIGRPRREEGERPSTARTVRLPITLWDRLAQKAKQENKTLNAVIREAALLCLSAKAREESLISRPRISSADLAWLAGLLEGEGCFSPQRYHSKTASYDLPSIQLGMTDRDVVERAGKLLGGKQRAPHHIIRKAPWKDIFRWKVSGRRALQVMKLILPFMGERRAARISEVIQKYESSRGPQGSRGYRARHRSR